MSEIEIRLSEPNEAAQIAALLLAAFAEYRVLYYMTLLKISGEWKIVNKSFYAEPKNPAPQ